jgi:photosystem I subunit 9
MPMYYVYRVILYFNFLFSGILTLTEGFLYLTNATQSTLFVRTTSIEGGFFMRDLKTYLFVAPVISTLWFGSLAGLLIEINRFFPGCFDIPFFFHSSY